MAVRDLETPRLPTPLLPYWSIDRLADWLARIAPEQHSKRPVREPDFGTIIMTSVSLSSSLPLFLSLLPGFQPVSDVQDDVSALLWSLLLSVDELSLLFIRRLRSFANWNSSTGTVHQQ